MNELSKNLMAVCIRNGAEIWVEKDKCEKLKYILLQSRENKFIEFENQIINTADIVGIFSPQTMEEIIRRKNGQWKCEYGRWHDKRQKCGCEMGNLNGEDLAKFSRGF